VRGSYAQGWRGADGIDQILPEPALRTEGRDRVTEHDYVYDASLIATAGLGRVRDATVVFDVHVLEERLQATGAFTRPLSQAAREKLASIFYMQPRYSAAHERPSRFFWRDVEEILRADGCLAGEGLGAFSLTRVQESYDPFRGPRFTRTRGWFAGPAIMASHSHSIRRTESESQSRRYDPALPPAVSSRDTSLHVSQTSDRFDIGGRLGYHQPLGWRWQVDVETAAFAPMRPGEEGFETTSSAQLVWLVADRWKADLGVDHIRAVFEPRDTDALEDDGWEVNWRARLGFYIEDRTELYAVLTQNQMRERGHGDFLGTPYHRATVLALGMRYRFLGALDAPGFLTPQRLLR